MSSAPLESTQPEKSNDSHTHNHTENGLLRPSPINPDIPMDPKPAERIILDDTKSDRDQKSLDEKSTSDVHQPKESVKSELSDTELTSENNEEKKEIVKSDDKPSDEKESVRIEYNHDEKRESNDASGSVKSNTKAETDATKVKSDQPTIVYAVKADESFQTSHRIPNVVEEGERKFETSHHIPTHIDTERIKSIENAKVAEKPSK